jgi:FKBP12-rapamycin complex-associated protein
LISYHELALETLMWIIGTLKSKTGAYLQYLVPVFARLLQRFEDIRDKLLLCIDKMIRLCGTQFG